MIFKNIENLKQFKQMSLYTFSPSTSWTSPSVMSKFVSMKHQQWTIYSTNLIYNLEILSFTKVVVSEALFRYLSQENHVAFDIIISELNVWRTIY